MKSLLVFVVSLFVAHAAFAKICKTAGPDGSMVFTDRPVESCDEANAHEGSLKVDASASKSVPATVASVMPATDAASTERSIIAIMALEDRVQRAYDFCAQLQPQSIRRYGDAIDGWRERNATATGKMRRALAQGFNGTQQRAIRDGVSTRNEQQLSPLRASLASAQFKWCERTTGEIESRSLDVAADLAAPLLSF